MKIIIPSYEPDKALIEVVSHLRRELPEADLIVVNDGSGPAYNLFFEAVLEHGVILLTHPENKGKGAALKTAFTYLMKNGIAGTTDTVVTIDSDGQHLIPDMVAVSRAVSGPREVVLGARAFVGKVPLRSRFGNKVTAKLFQWVTGQRVTDTQTGLRAFSTQLLPWLLTLDGDRFEYEFNMLLEAKRADVALKEVPIETVYIEENKRSHFRPLADSIRIYAPFLKFSGVAVTAAVIDASLFFLLMLATNNLLLSVVLSRVISALTQFYLNATQVFKGTSRPFKALVRYTVLALLLLACNYVIIQGLVGIGIGLVIAKVLTETILFLLSYRVQQTAVFA